MTKRKNFKNGKSPYFYLGEAADHDAEIQKHLETYEITGSQFWHDGEVAFVLELPGVDLEDPQSDE